VNRFIVLTVIGALVFAAVGLSSPMMSLYLESLGASYAYISIILTSYTATALVFNYAWGRISDVAGRRKAFLVLGLGGMAVANLLLSIVPNVASAWLVRILEGASMAAYGTISLALMGDLLEQENGGTRGRKGRRMGLYRGLASLAFAGAAVFGGRIADAFGLRLVFAVCAAIYLIAGIAALVTIKEPVPVRATQPVASLPTVKGARAGLGQLPILFLLGVLLWNMTHNASTSMWPNYMASLGYSKSALSTLWGFAAFIETPSMFLVGALSDITGRAAMLAAGAAGISFVNFGYLTLAAYLPALLGIQVLRGFGFGSYTASAMVFAAESSDSRTRGKASGVFYAAGSAGQLLGTFMGGNLVQLFGFSTLYLTCGLLGLVAAVCFIALAVRQRAATSAA